MSMCLAVVQRQYLVLRNSEYYLRLPGSKEIQSITSDYLAPNLGLTFTTIPLSPQILLMVTA